MTKLFSVLFLFILVPIPGSAETGFCPEDHPALSPAPLQEEWAVEWWKPRHEEKLIDERRETANLLFLGDSITQGWETVGQDVWQKYYGARKSFNLGFSGDRTENVLWRLEHGGVDGMHPELVILSIGTNNTGHRQDSAGCTAKGIEVILDELKDRLPEAEILLLAIFPRGEFSGDELRKRNSEINGRIEKLTDREEVYYLDLNHVFLLENGELPEELMPDYLHPNKEGYRLWAEAMEPMIESLTGE